MEKKKIDSYSAGYSKPAPFEIGRWYESLSQEEMEKFKEDLNEVKNREYVYKPIPANDEENEWYGDTVLLLFGKRNESDL